MRGEALRRLLSAYFDGELDARERADVESLLAESAEARAFLSEMSRVRQHLRDGPAGPDLTGRVLSAIETSRPARPKLRLAFAVGITIGVVFIGLALDRPGPVAAADIPERVLAAQTEVSSLNTRLSIVERGWHAAVPERVYTGSISYRAPESLWIEIRDETVYPSRAWVPNHSSVVVDGPRAWSQAVAGCPTEALPGCTPEQPRVRAITGREPFPDAAPAPLDLIVPAGGFSRAGTPNLVGLRAIDGRGAIGVEVTAAQVAGLIDGLTGVGNWREVHPTDRVELWLDRQALVPLAFTVFPAETADRALWAVRRGYHDNPDVAVLEVSWVDVEITDPVPAEFPAPPANAVVVAAGFGEGTADIPAEITPLLPPGMTLHRSGVVGWGDTPVSVASWSDGRAWLKLRWTHGWGASRLFGDMGALVRPVTVGAGVGYLNELGDRVAVHGEGIDLVLMGSLPTETLLAIAETIGITGQVVPEGWAESAAATVEEAREAVPGLMLPKDLDGFAAPAIRVETGIATLSYAGPGNRAFLLTQTVDRRLSPPLEANVRGVVVRRIDGRYSPDRGLLEWVEEDLVVGMTSTTLSFDELILIAESMGPG